MCGVRPINNVVDVTNYVMLECGHPLHAFDYRLLSGERVIVRRALPEEKMATLDGVERVLSDEMTVIADAEKVLAVAGVMGGAGSEIHDDTATVLLEAAAFDPRRTHRTSVALGLSTESSHRFERGVNVETVSWASDRAAALMCELAGGEVSAGVVDVWPKRCKRPLVTLDVERMHRLLGYELGLERSVEILESLMIPVVGREGSVLTVEIPAFRLDLEREADLIEEVVRMYGFQHVPANVPQATIVPRADDSLVRALFECRRRLVDMGLLESINYSFVPAGLLDKFDKSRAERRVVLPNPVSADQGVMRNSLVPQMVECLGRNHSRQVTDAALFEIGKVFRKDAWGKIGEDTRVCIGVMGKVGRGALEKRKGIEGEEVFLWAKGIIESLAASLRLQGLCIRPEDHVFCGRGESAEIVLNEKRVGFVGLLRDDLRHKYRMSEPVAVAEFRLEPFLANVFTTPVFAPIAQYPAISRDMAVVVDRGVQHGDILKIIDKVSPPELTGVELFDIFSGGEMKQGKKSMAYSLTYRSFERTLTDEDANGYHERIKDALKGELGVEIREG
jgi:phenylalanyl-tRNA synthetase beta chain